MPSSIELESDNLWAKLKMNIAGYRILINTTSGLRSIHIPL